MLDAALKLASLGYRVFPCREKTLGVDMVAKSPLTTNGFYSATRDEHQIRLWWERQWPNAAIGVPTEGLCVIDLDPRNGSGETIADRPELLDLFSAGAQQRTGSGGDHYIFRTPADLHCAGGGNGLGKGIDVKASGGYIIVAPSTIEGNSYKLISHDEWPAIGELPEIGGELLDMVRRSTAGPKKFDLDAEDWTDNRNERLYRFGVKLAAGGMRGGELQVAIETINSRRCKPPLGAAEVAGVITSVSKSRTANMPEVRLDTLLAALHVREAKSDGLQWASFDDIEEREVSWLWPRRIARGKMHLLAGEAGVGKSFWLCWLAAQVTRGGTWPDGGEIAAGRVAMLLGEDDPSDTIKPRLRAHGADLARVQLLQARQINGRPHAIDLQDCAGLIQQHCDTFPDLRLLIVDPVTEFLRAETNDNGQVRQALNPLTAVIRECGLAVINLTHLRKSNGRDKPGDIMNRVLGAGAFTAQARVVHGFVPQKDGTVKVVQAKNNLCQKPDPLTYEIEGGRVIHQQDVDLSGIVPSTAGVARFL